KNNERFYLSKLFPNWVVKYIAIIAKNSSIDTAASEGYCIEIGYVTGQIVEIDKGLILDNLKELLEREYIDSESTSMYGDCMVEKVQTKRAKLIEDIRKDMLNGDVTFKRLEPNECGERNPIRALIDPLEAGCSAANKKFDDISGTLGALFKIEEDDAVYALSNFHVFALKESKLDDTEKITQPSRSDAKQINIKSRVIGSLFWMCKNRKLDAAIAKISVPVNTKSKRSSKMKKIYGISEPKIGMKVIKYGRTTGATNGVIRSVYCTVNLSDKTNPKKKHIKRHQILTTCMSQQGDSGSILVDIKTNMAVGLIFAGRKSVNATYANKITEVFKSDRTRYKERVLPTMTFKEFI
ncbi:MAG: hypothetical protein AAF617_17015, partial [Bacteroidota bacterium]